MVRVLPGTPIGTIVLHYAVFHFLWTVLSSPFLSHILKIFWNLPRGQLGKSVSFPLNNILTSRQTKTTNGFRRETASGNINFDLVCSGKVWNKLKYTFGKPLATSSFPYTIPCRFTIFSWYWSISNILLISSKKISISWEPKGTGFFIATGNLEIGKDLIRVGSHLGHI